MQIWKIDYKGFFTESMIINEEELTELDIVAPVNTDETNTFYKPKWNGMEWIEGATAEEIAEWNEQQNSPPLSKQIEDLKTQIAETDYQIIKCYEYNLVNKELPYDVESLHIYRQALRDEINQLELQEQGGVDNARNI